MAPRLTTHPIPAASKLPVIEIVVDGVRPIDDLLEKYLVYLGFMPKDKNRETFSLRCTRLSEYQLINSQLGTFFNGRGQWIGPDAVVFTKKGKKEPARR
jgi:hypothetical protein